MMTKNPLSSFEQELKPTDNSKRRVFASYFLEQYQTDNRFGEKLHYENGTNYRIPFGSAGWSSNFFRKLRLAMRLQSMMGGSEYATEVILAAIVVPTGRCNICHTTRETMTLLAKKFLMILLSRRKSNCVFFLWRYLEWKPPVKTSLTISSKEREKGGIIWNVETFCLKVKLFLMETFGTCIVSENIFQLVYKLCLISIIIKFFVSFC